MEEHDSNLQKMCRVGGKRFSFCTQATRYPISDYKTQLETTFNIDISHDEARVHPQYICVKCQRTLKRASTKSMHGGGGCGPAHEWEPHQRTRCSTCSLYAEQSKGAARKNKQQKRAPVKTHGQTTSTQSTASSTASTDTPSLNISTGMDIDEAEVELKATPKYTAEIPLTRERFVDKSSVQECTICSKIVDGAIISACCEEIFCCKCICQWLNTNNTCPHCGSEMRASTSLSTPSKVLRRVISSWEVHCDFHAPALNGCPTTTQLSSLKEHVAKCAHNPATSDVPIRTVRPTSTVSDILNASPSKLKGDVARKLGNHYVMANVVDNKFETWRGSHGKPKIFTHTPAAGVSSCNASSRTIGRRNQGLDKIQQQMSGGADGARAQQIAGLQRLTAKERDEFLREAGIKPTTQSPGTLLAIKAHLNLPWNQIRKLKRWLRAFGVELESEKTARQFIAQHVPKYVKKEVPMVKRNGDVVLASMVCFPDLAANIIHYLDMYERNNELTWRNGTIPSNKIWLKLGGDHGGGSFKFVMQIANHELPNSVFNTIPICIFDCHDTYNNLATALSIYADQIRKLQSEVTWRGYSFTVFMFGDYEFLAKVYGLSGPSGARPCLYCLCPKKQMDKTPHTRDAADSVLRTLDSLAADHDRFVSDGSNQALVKNYNNALRSSLFPVPVENVVVPALHLDLGIFPWIFDCFVDEVRQLDLQLAASTAANESDTRSYTDLSKLHADRRSAEQAIEGSTMTCNTVQKHIQTVAMGLADTPGVETLIAAAQQHLTRLQEQHDQLKKQLESIQSSILEKEKGKTFSGPCMESLDPVLQSNKIDRQAYHGGAFVGNHVKLALQPAAIDQIVNAPVTILSERYPALLQDAEALAVRYKALLSSYAKCRGLYNHSNPVSDEDIDGLDVEIAHFLSLCRQHIVERNLGHITPKLHLLESHTLPLLKRLRVGLGLLAEHGSESIHARFNSLENRSFNCIRNNLERLGAMAEQHLVRTMPELDSLIPTPQSKKPKE